MITWNMVATEFLWDGSWRDICVRDAQFDDWQVAIQAILASGLRTTFLVDGSNVPLPTDVTHVFEKRREATVLLTVIMRAVQLNCHFFDEAEIEFDLDPRQVTAQAELDDILAFMTLLAVTTQKPAVMTPENMHNAPFIQVTPSGRAEYISFGGPLIDLTFL